MSNTQVGWKLWQRWVLACIIGGIVGFVTGLPIFIQYKTVLGTAIGWAVFGVFWGIAQHLVLLQHLSRTNGSWVLASVVGVLISLAIAEHLFSALGRNIGWVVVGAVGSIVQYLVLRQRFLWTNMWVPASGVAVAIGMAVGEVVHGAVATSVISALGGPAGGGSGLSAMVRSAENIVGGFVGLAVGGSVGLAIYGSITGGVLVWLLRHPRVK